MREAGERFINHKRKENFLTVSIQCHQTSFYGPNPLQELAYERRHTISAGTIWIDRFYRSGRINYLRKDPIRLLLRVGRRPEPH